MKTTFAKAESFVCSWERSCPLRW